MQEIWQLYMKTMPDIGIMRWPRPDPSLLELCQSDDKVLHDFVDHFKESMSKGMKNNISFEDNVTSLLIWRGLYEIFHKLKHLQNIEEEVAQLKEHLKEDDDEPHIISVSPMYLNLFFMSDQEV